MRLDKCNDSGFASKLVVDVRADFFNAEGAEYAEIRCAPLRNFAVKNYPANLAMQLDRCHDFDFALINLDYTIGYTLYTDPGVLLKVFFVQGK